MKDVFNTWRGFILERDAKFDTGPEGKGEPIEVSRQRWETLKSKFRNISNIWIFFDTETTGLDPRNKDVQVTELAASAYDFSDWLDGSGVPRPLQISSIPEEYKTIISDGGEYSSKVVLRPEVNKEVKKQEQLMSITDKNDPLHIQYAQDEIIKRANRIAFQELERMHNERPDAQLMYNKTPRSKKLDPTSNGWNLWRRVKEDYIQNTSPQDIPLYNEMHTDNIEEAGYGPDDKKATLTALLNMARYSEGDVPYKKEGFVFSSFTEYLALVKANSQQSTFGMMAHNSRFDVKQMNAAYEKAEVDVPGNFVYDSIEVFRSHLTPIVQSTMLKIQQGEQVSELDERIAKVLAKNNSRGDLYISLSLGPIVEAFNLPKLGWHAAIADVRMTISMFVAVINYVEDWLQKQEQSQQTQIIDMGGDADQTSTAQKTIDYFSKGKGEPPKIPQSSGGDFANVRVSKSGVVTKPPLITLKPAAKDTY